MTDVSITHANPEVDRAPAAILEIEDLVVKYPLRVGWFGRANQYVYAVRGVSLSENAGQTVALVGESGCGKTSLGRAALGLIKSAAGRVRFGGELISAMPRAAMRPLRPRMQMVFQDPFSCLNPRMPVATIVGEALLAHGRCGKSQLHQRVNDVLAQVGLEAQHKSRYPHASELLGRLRWNRN